jgi:3-hydroxyisobutyrate dehydrogenase-like beta-hydroxyacid dehydrogenase
MHTVENSRQRVTVMGLGAMGATLARVLLARGHEVTVWNRTAARAEPLVADGAVLAATPAAAGASSLIILCTIDKHSSEGVLLSAATACSLEGRVVVDLSTGSAAEASRLASRAEAMGGRYLDGGIMCYPRDIGGRDTMIVYSGSESGFQEHAETLAGLAGAQRYLGRDAASAPTVYLALWAFYFGALAAYAEGAALAGTAGMGLPAFEDLASTMLDKFRDGVANVTRRTVADDFRGDQATVDVHYEGQVIVRDACVCAGLPCEVTEAYLSYLRRAQQAGHGSEDIAALFRPA